MAYVPPYELTKMDIAALKHASYILICRHREPDEESLFQAVKTFEKSAKNPFEHREYHTIAAPVRGHYNYKTPEAQYRCVTSVTLYRSQHCAASSILATLRAGDEIALEFSPDGHSNDYVRTAGLHADVLYLHVYRKGVSHATFELESSICPDNSARMCRMLHRPLMIAAS